MTTEEKAKAYDEALEKTRIYRDNARIAEDYIAVARYENIFPQLRESEDERIRNEIITFIEQAIHSGGGVSVSKEKEDKWIAYLEKQKELPFVKDVVLGFPGLYFYDGERMHFRGNPALEDSPYYFAMKQQEEKQKDFAADEYWRGFKNGRDEVLANPDRFNLQEKQKEPENVSASTMAPSCWAEEPSLQKEQKPAKCIEDSVKFEEGFKAGRESGLRDGQKYVLNNLDSYGLCKSAEWSEEDERIRNAILEFLNPDKGGTKYSSYAGLVEWSDWLKSLRPRQNPIVAVDAEQLLKILPKRQEWSEEDKMYLSQAIETLERENYLILADKLKSLRPQPKQEWSEEDKMIRQKLIRFISSPNIEGFMLASDEQMFVSWLKSLHPMPKVAVADGILWKPSEEQMYALGTVVKGIGEATVGSIAYNLKELYEHLKQL